MEIEYRFEIPSGCWAEGKFPRRPDQEFKGGKYTLKAVIVAYDSIETHAVLLPVCGGGDGHYLTEHAREMIAV